ncbi:hypothetical protein QJS83_12725 [Bdellovibrio sp. 22V]|uniref:hypothetical protein n=1 Tax=Bdellovibrio sp. 22V TaxID=3044166 RepID=UPI0025429770|nr:hypothetical protein [Bdellovibrio sp. 22V]WII71327.1 hypothetical protein QJS83_12725 [Bdellovibrio sp. 22V]
MRFLYFILLMSLPLPSWAQEQTKSQCMSTVRARSLSITSAQAEKLCGDDAPEVVDCAISAMQSKGGSISENTLKGCREQWDVKSRRPEPTPSPSPAVKKGAEPVLKVPVEELESSEAADEGEVSN